MNINSITLFILLVSSTIVSGQGMTKEQVSQQSQFIEAKSQNAIGRYDKGTKILEELYKEDRTNSDIAFELAKAYAETDEPTLVDKYAQIAIKNTPSNPWYSLFYGEYLMKNNQPESAINYFNNLKDIEPNKDEHYDRLARAYNYIKDYKKAISVYDQMEQKFGAIPEIIMQKFKAYDLLQDYDNAIAQVSRLVQKYPTNEDYLLVQAESYLTAGKKQLAMEAFKQVLEIDPSNTQANLALLGTGDKTENENLYLRSLLPIIDNPSINIDAKVKELLPYIQNLAAGKDLELKDALIEAGDRMIQTHPTDAKAFAAYADILYNSGNIKAAVKQYEKTITLDDNVFAVWEQLLYSLDELEEHDKLLIKSEECIDYFPNQAVGFYFHGKALTYINKYDDANETLDEALKIAGSNMILKSTILAGKGYNYITKGDLVRAKESIDKSLQIADNRNPVSYQALGNYYEAKKDIKKAISNWEKSIEMGNNSPKLIAKVEANKS